MNQVTSVQQQYNKCCSSGKSAFIWQWPSFGLGLLVTFVSETNLELVTVSAFPRMRLVSEIDMLEPLDSTCRLESEVNVIAGTFSQICCISWVHWVHFIFLPALWGQGVFLFFYLQGQNVGITSVIALLSLKCQDKCCFFLSRCAGRTVLKVYLFTFLL